MNGFSHESGSEQRVQTIVRQIVATNSKIGWLTYFLIGSDRSYWCFGITCTSETAAKGMGRQSLLPRPWCQHDSCRGTGQQSP